MIASTRQKEFINTVLDAFYTKAVSDFLIGYQFRKIKEGAETTYEDIFFPALGAFSTHLARIRAFWHIQLLAQKKPAAEPPFDLIAAHRPLFIKRGELDRWLLLFEETLALHQTQANDEVINELSACWRAKVALFGTKLKEHLL